MKTLRKIVTLIFVLTLCLGIRAGVAEASYKDYKFEEFKNPSDANTIELFTSYEWLGDNLPVKESCAVYDTDVKEIEGLAQLRLLYREEVKYLNYVVYTDNTDSLFSFKANRGGEHFDGVETVESYLGLDGKAENHYHYNSLEKKDMSLDSVLAETPNIGFDNYLNLYYAPFSDKISKSYLLIFNKDAKSISDLKYVVDLDNIQGNIIKSATFIERKDNYFIPDTATPNFSLTKTKDKLGIGGTIVGGSYKLEYKLPDAVKYYDTLNVESDYIRYIECKDLNYKLEEFNVVENTIDLGEIDIPKNGTYTLNIVTYNTTYTFDFTVDYITTLKDIALDTPKSANTTADNVAKLKVSVSNIPKSTKKNEIVVTFTTSEKTLGSINGESLTKKSKYKKSFSYTIDRNGEYTYEFVTKDGRIETGYFEVSCFSVDNFSDDIADNSLMSPLTDGTSSGDDFIDDNALAKTGIQAVSFILIVAVLCVGFYLVVKGGREDEGKK